MDIRGTEVYKAVSDIIRRQVEVWFPVNFKSVKFAYSLHVFDPFASDVKDDATSSNIQLGQNYPNPANENTTIYFSLACPDGLNEVNRATNRNSFGNTPDYLVCLLPYLCFLLHFYGMCKIPSKCYCCVEELLIFLYS